ncbi:MAG: HAD hydrolase-like protein [Xanthomonadales bacterium]
MGGIAHLDNVLFDLDGTLVDSRGTITASIDHALERIGAARADGPSVAGLIGLPLFDIFTATYGLPRATALQAIDHYRRHYDRLSPEGSRVYDDVRQDLERLRGGGLRLFVATVKPTPIAKKVLSDLRLDGLFEGIAGASMGPERREKTGIIAHALARFDLDPARSLMVGDRDQDVAGARANGLRAVGVTYGFGSREEILASQPDFVSARPGAITDIVTGLGPR